jgi:hypothetical protein
VIALQPHTAKTLTAANILVRLRAEFLWASGKAESAEFHFTSGHLSTWKEWASGLRPTVSGKNVSVAKTAPPDESRTNYTGWLESVFRYGTVYSLFKDTEPAKDREVEAGDVLLKLGRPGHALMVLDVAKNAQGQVKVLLGEGGTPVQTFHVPRGKDGSPWFSLGKGQAIELGPKGGYQLKDLYRWPG